MKFFLLLCLITSNVTAQTKNIYNTKINKAKKVDIKNSTVTILKADTVMVINENNSTKMFLKNSEFTKDSGEIYLTTYKFVPQDDRNTFQFNISMKFDRKFDYAYDPSLGYVGLIEGPGSLTENVYVDSVNNIITAKGTGAASSNIGITFRVKTKGIPNVIVQGIQGKLN